MRIAVAASGALGLETLMQLLPFAELACVLTDSRSTGIIEWCSANKIPLFKGNPKDGRAASFIADISVDVLFSINYLFILEKDIINWPNRYAFNIHGSLLPKYRGRTPHVWAIINNEKVSGYTVHHVDAECDAGDVVLQKKIAINETMTGADLLNIFSIEYPLAVTEVLERVRTNNINSYQQDNSRATYFGKRTPDDGLIQWDWQRERIYNWVRAQANPYPGAFAYYENNKVVIHQVSLHDQGFTGDDRNGKILLIDNGKPVVKTPNGAIRLEIFNSTVDIQFSNEGFFHA